MLLMLLLLMLPVVLLGHELLLLLLRVLLLPLLLPLLPLLLPIVSLSRLRSRGVWYLGYRFESTVFMVGGLRIKATNPPTLSPEPQTH